MYLQLCSKALHRTVSYSRSTVSVRTVLLMPIRQVTLVHTWCKNIKKKQVKKLEIYTHIYICVYMYVCIYAHICIYKLASYFALFASVAK